MAGRRNASRHSHSLARVGGDNFPCNGRPESSAPSLDPQAQSAIAVKHSQIGVRLVPSLPGAMVQCRGRQAHRDCPWPPHIPTRQRAHRRGPGLTLPKCFTPRGAIGQRDTRKRTKNVRCAINTPKRSRHLRPRAQAHVHCARETRVHDAARAGRTSIVLVAVAVDHKREPSSAVASLPCGQTAVGKTQYLCDGQTLK